MKDFICSKILLTPLMILLLTLLVLEIVQLLILVMLITIIMELVETVGQNARSAIQYLDAMTPFFLVDNITCFMMYQLLHN